ncbi:MAG: hypothetical protein R2699_06280 [Acidimicrobiales bacterium]|nr:hypothetical protein [Acidimicrobiales bacterium]MCB1259107.1 hypothetical protein [Acidimicrobiales bacterium]
MPETASTGPFKIAYYALLGVAVALLVFDFATREQDQWISMVAVALLVVAAFINRKVIKAHDDR